MIWKRYRNEMIVLATFILMLAALAYKSSEINKLDNVKQGVDKSIEQIGEIIALKKQWGNENLTKRVLQIKKSISPEKIKTFNVKSKKLFASLKSLSDSEVNRIILKLENTAVQIVKLDVKRKNGNYDMEIKCKW